jgi:hypothetical protein
MDSNGKVSFNIKELKKWEKKRISGLNSPSDTSNNYNFISTIAILNIIRIKYRLNLSSVLTLCYIIEKWNKIGKGVSICNIMLNVELPENSATTRAIHYRLDYLNTKGLIHNYIENGVRYSYPSCLIIEETANLSKTTTILS